MRAVALSLLGIAAAAGGIWTAAFVFVLFDRYGPNVLLIGTGIITWIVLAAIGLLTLWGRWLDRLFEDQQIRTEFTRWYLARLRERRSTGMNGGKAT